MGHARKFGQLTITPSFVLTTRSCASYGALGNTPVVAARFQTAMSHFLALREDDAIAIGSDAGRWRVGEGHGSSLTTF